MVVIGFARGLERGVGLEAGREGEGLEAVGWRVAKSSFIDEEKKRAHIS